jgi:hypothetical protein
LKKIKKQAEEGEVKKRLLVLKQLHRKFLFAKAAIYHLDKWRLLHL